MRFQHGRKNDAMKNYIILANKVYKFRVFFAPVISPFISQFFCSADITNGCIKPYIQYFSFGIWQWNLYTPGAVPCHRAALQPVIQPAFALTIHIILPFLMVFQYPLLQPGLIILQWKIPVFGFLFYWYSIA